MRYKNRSFITAALSILLISFSAFPALAAIPSLTDPITTPLLVDISKDFTDSKFKQKVWEWLGNSGTPGRFTQLDIDNMMSGQNYTLAIVDEGIKSINGIEHFEGLKYIYASRNKLSSVPNLPDTLISIDFNMNEIKTLPTLPYNLEYLSVLSNELTSLPQLPDSLVSLVCSNNKLKELPDLPASLDYLSCSYNELSELPTLPTGLSSLYCSNNSIYKLPELPSGLQALEIQNNYLNVFERPLSMTLLHMSGIKKYVPQYRIAYMGPQITLDINGTKQLSADEIIKRMSSDNVVWGDVESIPFSKLVFSSSDNSIVKVDSAGLITGKGRGLSSVRVGLRGADTDFAVVDISVNVSSQIAAGELPAEEAAETGSSSVDYLSASSWAVPELEAAEQYGLITDKVKTRLKAEISREEFCSIAVRLYEALTGDQAAPSLSNPFNDSSDADVLKAYELGIVNGITANTFAPDRKITRQEICVMIVRALRAADPDLNTTVAGVVPFSDEGQIASWAIQEVRFSSQNDIMKGVGGNRIDPLSNTSREQGVILVKRTYENFLNQ